MLQWGLFASSPPRTPFGFPRLGLYLGALPELPVSGQLLVTDFPQVGRFVDNKSLGLESVPFYLWAVWLTREEILAAGQSRAAGRVRVLSGSWEA